MDLSQLNLEAVGDLLSSLSDKDVENITKLAGELFSSGQQERKTQSQEPSGKELPFDMDTVMRIASVMSKLSSQPEDPRCRLLRDLKPMLSRQRQQRVDTAIQLLQMISLMPVLKELN